jgi:hypothetical protein
VRDLNGSPLTGVAGITFALYSEQTGGAALWMETQNVTADSGGHYTVLLGSTKSAGLPTELFNSEQARWVGVQVQGQAEQPRVLLVSAPYALKAGDAETIGGLPPSAFVLAVPPSSGPAAASGRAGIAVGSRDMAPETATDVTTTGGTANYLPFFTGASTILDSVVYQTGTGSTTRIGINTSAPATTLDVKGSGTIRGALSLPSTGAATATAGKSSEPLNLGASAFNSSVSTAVAQTFQLKAEPVGNDTATASGVLSLLYGSGTSAPAETGLQIATNGQITFAAGQTFPGAGSGTVTSVGSGAGLTGGPITGSGSLRIATGGVGNAMLANPSLTVTAGGGMTGGGSVSLGGSTTLGLKTCSANQVLEYIGNVWTCTTIGGGGTITGVTAGKDLTGGGTSGTVTLNLDTTKVPQLDTANTFAATQTIGSGDVSVSSGNLDLPDTTAATAGVINLGGSAFLHQCCNTGSGYTNTFVGREAGNFSTTGGYNTASGYGALFLNGTGTDNTASGYVALDTNSAGSYNTATGDHALYSNNTGSNNTASGASALYVNLGGSGNTAVGFSAGTDSHRIFPTSGSNSTFVGANANATVDNLTNATAIGYNAQVGESNALVLGNGAMVGIGTPTPQYALDVHGTGSFTGAVTVTGLTAGKCVQAGTGGLLATTASPCGSGGGGGTVTSVGSGAGLTGGPITTTGTLSIASGGVTDAMLNNPYAGTGECASSAFVNTLNRAAGPTCLFAVTGITAGTGLTGGPITTSGTLSIDTTVVPELGANNTFRAPQFVFANTAVSDTLYVENDDSNPDSVVLATLGGAFEGVCIIEVSGNLTCSGAVSGVVKTSDSRQVAVYSVQSSENWIDDYGSGALVNGVATIAIEPQFAQTVTTDAGYHVFLTPNGDCEGLYVTQKGAASFEVHEAKGGKSNVQFDYRIVAHRKGFEAQRLTDVTATFGKKVQLPAKIKADGASQH